MTWRARSRGVTLVEMLVVLLVFGLLGGMSVLAVGRLQSPVESEHVATWRRARAAAIRSGQPVAVTGDSGTVVRFLPDGRALGAGVDPLTGEVRDATR
jgi:prepilin-type N-terminal cleavage/methylation domain-containing protein